MSPWAHVLKPWSPVVWKVLETLGGGPSWRKCGTGTIYLGAISCPVHFLAMMKWPSLLFPDLLSMMLCLTIVQK
jgi:hypothetical protein